MKKRRMVSEEEFEARLASIRGAFEVPAYELYMDSASTTQMDERVCVAMEPYWMSDYANPACVHESGRKAAAAVEKARGQVAEALWCSPDEVYFTSGGTEANNWAIKGALWKQKDAGYVLVGEGEHPSVMEAAKWMVENNGYGIGIVHLKPDGQVDLDELGEFLESRNSIGLVSIQHANGETGIINPIPLIAEMCKRVGVLLHVDATQSFGKIDIRVRLLGADMVTVSAHKIHGPNGVGALYIRRGLEIENLLHGGGQEKGCRSGTVPTALIVGFGKAAELARVSVSQEMPRVEKIRKQLEAVLKDRYQVEIAGEGSYRLPTVSKVILPDVDGDLAAGVLDIMGCRLSTGTACASRKDDDSRVLRAMGVSDAKVHRAFRVSLSKLNGNSDHIVFADMLGKALVEARKRDV